MSERRIQELLKKYLEGKATPQEKQLIDDWYDSLMNPQDSVHVAEHERQTLRDSYWNALKAAIGFPERGKRRFLPGFIGIAATVAAVVIVSALHFQTGNTLLPRDKTVGIASDSHYNDSERKRDVLLPDGSRIELFPGSTLKVIGNFNYEERTVELTGEAFFDISRDEAKPFYVYTNEVVTRVLGTSFLVRAYPEDEKITVSVMSGKVSVSTYEDEVVSDDVILMPNQEAVFDRVDQKVARKLVEEPQIVITEEEVKKIRFEGASPSEIFRALEKMYGVEITFEESKFSDCSLTTSLDGEDLYERIDVICEITGSRYEIQDTRIVIEGTGCN